ncbi:Ribonuclease H-like domain containing protein, partial [Trema orientale]
SWAHWLPWAEYWYNTSFHTSIKTTPFRFLYGRDPPQLLPYDKGATVVSSLDKQLQERDTMLEDLKIQLHRAQQRMKTTADKHRREIQFEVGDLVYLKLRPYRQRSLARRYNEKLSPRYYGPYKVLSRIGSVAYKLDLPRSSSVHPVFHVSQLCRAIGASQPISELPPHLSAELELLVEPDAVLGVRSGTGHASFPSEVLVRWKGLPDFEATWESYDMIQHQFPSFHLEDKVALAAGGNDRPPIRFTYVRRGKKGN